MSGINNSYTKTSTTSFTNNTTLATVNLGGTNGVPIAANQKMFLHFWIPVIVGAAGGLRFQIVTPAGVASFLATVQLFNTVAPSQTVAVQTSSTVFTNALADAGNHWLEVELAITNGATAGTVDIQFAQNTSNGTALQVLEGAKLETVSFS